MAVTTVTTGARHEEVGDDSRMLETGAAYLRGVGPAYGFFGLGLSLYFASQGAAQLFSPLFAGLLRLLIAVGVGWAVLHLTGSLDWLFAALAVALVVYGLTLTAAVASGVWVRTVWRPGGRRSCMRMPMRSQMPLDAADRQVEKSA
jgi:hypothetical protein